MATCKAMAFGSSHVYVEDEDADTEEEISDGEEPKPKPVNWKEDEIPLLIPADDDPAAFSRSGSKKPGGFGFSGSIGSDQADSDEDTTLSVKNVYNSLKKVIDWFTFGLQVDIPHHKLQSFKNGKNEDHAKQEAIRYWLDNDPNASWEKVADAVEKMEFRVVAQDIRKKYVEVQVQTDGPEAAATSGSGSKPAKKGGKKKPKVRFAEPEPDYYLTGKGGRNRYSGVKVDTNVLIVKFGVISEAKPVHTGDPLFCQNEKCTAILNHLSVLREKAGKPNKVWVCDFCDTENDVDIVQEEVPLKEDVLYMITPQTSANSSKQPGDATACARDSIVVFCIDISGSMGVSTEVSGNFELKGHERLQRLRQQFADGESQYLLHERRDITYVSRLQSVQAAIDRQLTSLVRNNPNQKVALVTFNNEVTVLGHNRATDVIITGDRLGNYDALVDYAAELTIPQAIKRTRESLSKKILSLEENGQTALGPAFLISILLAGRMPGSKVIICTDGLANKGIGRLDELKTHDAVESAQAFYTNLGTTAKEKSVTVSVCTIRGTECRLLELGRVADITGGKVDIVDPRNIADEFSSILATPTIGTEVNARIVLHQDLFIRNDVAKESVMNIPVGNVTANTQLTYQFGIKPSKMSLQSAQLAGGRKMLQMPFQLQIRYTDADGSRCMRVITQARPVTTDKKLAEQGIDQSAVGCHYARESSRFMNLGFSSHSFATNSLSLGLLRRANQVGQEVPSAMSQRRIASIQRRLKHEAIENDSCAQRNYIDSGMRQESLWKFPGCRRSHHACTMECAVSDEEEDEDTVDPFVVGLKNPEADRAKQMGQEEAEGKEVASAGSSDSPMKIPEEPQRDPVPSCPNASNPYHHCSTYCERRWENGSIRKNTSYCNTCVDQVEGQGNRRNSV